MNEGLKFPRRGIQCSVREIRSTPRGLMRPVCKAHERSHSLELWRVWATQQSGMQRASNVSEFPAQDTISPVASPRS